MKVYSRIIGNIHRSPVWKEKLKPLEVEYVFLDQWTAQKSRFLARGDKGTEYPVALERNSRVTDGDIICYAPEERKAAVLRIELNPVLVIELEELARKAPETVLHTAVELGHAIGNQHWPAVVKGYRVFVPLTVDKKVMLSVMETHHIEGISYAFQPGQEIIPYLAPHEIRRLFGGTGQESHAHTHPEEGLRHPEENNIHAH
ncbi:MAG: urease accessory protein UreE [Coprobacter sp.]|nr:urease accessory protein UreE [Coprobacter sp.]